MRLSDIFKSDNYINETKNVPRLEAAKTAEISRQIRAMTPGQTLNGEIVAKNGSEVSIRLGEDFMLNAKLEQNMNLDVGKMMTFEVRNNGKALTLSPLFANTATDANVLKALDMAMLPINDTTVEMADQMMSAGMSVDKASIQQMYREVSSHMDADIADIIDLHKLGMPVNEENLEQIAAYKNLNHQIIDSVNLLTEELSGAWDRLASEGDVGTQDAARLLLDIIRIVSEGEGNDVKTESAVTDPALIQSSSETPEEAGNEIKTAARTVVTEELMTAESGAEIRKETAGIDKKMLVRDLSGKLPETEGTLGKKVINEEAKVVIRPSGAFSGEESTEQVLKENGKNLPAERTDSELNSLLREEYDILRQAAAEHDTDTIKKILSDPGLKKLVSEKLQREMTLKPEEFADKSKVESFYKKISAQLKEISHSLENSGQTEQPVFKTVTSLSQNVDFLHQVNQMYAYVQIPLKLVQGDAHGDLYVYTNKRNLSAKDGKVSALLHLDMQFLGPLDVYVAMENSNVSTNFYVKDDSMLDFLEEHMDLLTRRLEDRGYHISCSMKVRDGASEEGGIKPLLKKEGGTVVLSQYAFDVRA